MREAKKHAKSVIIQSPRTDNSPSLPRTARGVLWRFTKRRNCPSYPPTRTDDFDAYEDAVEYLKKVAPETPRVSLGKRCPNPPPSWDEFQDWLEASNLPRMPY